MDSEVKSFIKDYINGISKELLNLDIKKIIKIKNLILKTIKNNKTIYVCGNGGSSSISNHYVCDYLKLIRHNTNLKPKVISLTSNSELLTAISNDLDYSEVFKYQIESLGKQNDLVIIISSSGNSKNVVKIAEYCKRKKIKTVSFTGLTGGKLKKQSTINLHLNLKTYGQTEDSHHILMHIILHYLVKSSDKKKKKLVL